MYLPVRFENPPSYLTEVGLWSYIQFYFFRCNRCMSIHSYFTGDARGISNMSGLSQRFFGKPSISVFENVDIDTRS